VRVRGANMGQCAYVEAAEAQDGGLIGGYTCGSNGILVYGHPAGSVIDASARLNCAPSGVLESDTTGLADSFHDCFITAVPMGEGDGLFYGDPQPYALRVMVGDQSLHLAQRASDVAQQLSSTINLLDQQAASANAALENTRDTNALVSSMRGVSQIVRRDIPLRYQAPSVIAVTTPGNNVPTKGGSTLTVAGTNFGTTIPGR